MKLYGKAPLTELLTSTAAENRLPHAILLTGESGSGRRTIAKYIAKLFMCGAPPCGGCAACNKTRTATLTLSMFWTNAAERTT